MKRLTTADIAADLGVVKRDIEICKTKLADINIVKKDIEIIKHRQTEMADNLRQIKKTLMDPDDGAIARVNKNTSFRKNTTRALWTIYGVLIGILAKVFFWN